MVSTVRSESVSSYETILMGNLLKIKKEACYDLQIQLHKHATDTCRKLKDYNCLLLSMKYLKNY